LRLSVCRRPLQPAKRWRFWHFASARGDGGKGHSSPGYVAAHFTPGFELQAQAREAEMMIPILLLGIPALFALGLAIFVTR
jgi:hypothetical protein